MSRSYKHTQIGGNTTSASEKKDKRFANRAWRRIVKMRLFMGHYDILPLQREVSNIWSFAKDGKGWFNDKRYMRK